MTVPNGRYAGTDTGPLVSAAARNRTLNYVQTGVEEGATLLLDGREADVPETGYFPGPTVLGDVEPDVVIARDEIFGLVVPLLRATDFEDAIGTLNRSEYGNTVIPLYEDLECPADPRLRIEHLELATDDQIDRMADAGIIASMQPNFLQWGGEEGVYQRVLGSDIEGGHNRFADVLDAGGALAFGSDTMPMGPLHGIHQTVTATSDSQRLSVADAVAANTRGGACAEGTEDRKGTSSQGCSAMRPSSKRTPSSGRSGSTRWRST